MSPLAVQLFYTIREHFGAFAGIQRFVPHLNSARFLARSRPVQDNDDDFPKRFLFRSPYVRDALRSTVQRRGQRWYKLSDLAAEAAVLGPWLCGCINILHYLDGEHTAQYLPALPRRLRLRGCAIATYHQPPTVLPQVVAPDVVRRLDHVTVVATSQLDYFTGILPDTRVSVLHYGVDTEFFIPHAVAPSSPLSNAFRCVSVGSYLRDWELLVEVARLLSSRREIELHVVSASTAPFGALGNVIVHRGIDDQALRELYRRADVVVLPLFDATANNALLEGMAMALPVIASDLPSLREYAPAEAAFFLPKDPKRFAEAIVGLAEDRAMRQAMGKAGRTRAESLAWPAVARAYESLYERLV